jgi:hypothetical protein
MRWLTIVRVERQPRRARGVRLDPTAQQRGLAIARRRRDERNAATLAQSNFKLFDQTRACDEVGPQRRQRDLGGEQRRRHALDRTTSDQPAIRIRASRAFRRSPACAGLHLSDIGPEPIEIQYARSSLSRINVWRPWWIFTGSVNLIRRETRGGNRSDDARRFWAAIFLMICATSIETQP